MKLLGRKTSGNVQKVMWLFEELKMPYTREDYGRQFNNNTQTPEYLRMNPNAKVPTLVDGELAIWESNTILRYVAAKAKSALYPADAGKRTHVERWMDWQLAALNGPYLAMFKDSKLEPEKRSPDFATSRKTSARSSRSSTNRSAKSPGLRWANSASPTSASGRSSTAACAFRSSCRRCRT